jgi:hypothetical protein
VAAFLVAVSLALLAAVVAGRLGDRAEPIQPEDPYVLTLEEKARALADENRRP